jgi:hypothetical protein
MRINRKSTVGRPIYGPICMNFLTVYNLNCFWQDVTTNFWQTDMFIMDITGRSLNVWVASKSGDNIIHYYLFVTLYECQRPCKRYLTLSAVPGVHSLYRIKILECII